MSTDVMLWFLTPAASFVETFSYLFGFLKRCNALIVVTLNRLDRNTSLFYNQPSLGFTNFLPAEYLASAIRYMVPEIFHVKSCLITKSARRSSFSS